MRGYSNLLPMDFSPTRQVELHPHKVGTCRAEFIVARQVIVELKVVIKLEDAHLAQAENYLVAYNYPKGLLINFRSVSLQNKLVFNPRLNAILDKP